MPEPMNIPFSIGIVMIKKLFQPVLLLLIFFCINIGFSQDITNNSDANSELTTNIGVSITYHNKRMYFVNRPIIVEFQIVNRGFSPFLFITSYNKMFTFDFEILTPTHQEVAHSREYTVRTTQFEPILNDEITLKHNETYGVRIDVSSWFDLSEPGEYLIKGIFYPQLKTGADDDVRINTENELYLNLNPPFEEQVQKAMEIEEIKKMKAENLPPYDVVKFLLQALQAHDYDKYFLYIKFDKFIMQFGRAREKYIAAHDIDKPAVIEEFKQYLKGLNRLEEVPFSEVIPADFDIEKTVIEKRNATVTVIETFKYLQLVEKKRYTYYLHLYGDKWLLESYSVVNIGS